MSRDNTRDIVGRLELIGLLDALCIESVPDLLAQLPELFRPVFSREITNVIFSTTEPNITNRDTLWVKQNNAGSVIGLYTYSGGKWTALVNTEKKPWIPDVSSIGGMVVALTAHDTIYNEASGYLKVDGILTFTLSGTPSSSIYFTLPEGYTNDMFQTMSVMADDGGVVGAFAFPDTPTDKIIVRKYGSMDWTLGTGRIIRFSGSIPLV